MHLRWHLLELWHVLYGVGVLDLKVCLVVLTPDRRRYRLSRKEVVDEFKLCGSEGVDVVVCPEQPFYVWEVEGFGGESPQLLPIKEGVIGVSVGEG